MAEEWDRPKVGKPPYDNDRKPLLELVGVCIAVWSQVEHAQWLTFCNAVEPESPFPGLSSFPSGVINIVQGTAQRHELFRLAAKIKCPHFETRIEGLLKRTEGWRARRNDVAHGWLANLDKLGWCWAPQTFVPKTWKDDTAVYQYKSTDLEKFARAFDKLATDWGTLNADIRDFSIEKWGDPCALN